MRGTHGQMASAGTSCDVCMKRQKQVSAVTKCTQCGLYFCHNCNFTHSNIPACKAHVATPTTLGGVPYEGTSVDDDSLLSTDGGSDVTEDGPTGGVDLACVDCPRFQFQFQIEFTTSDQENDEVVPQIRDVVMLESGIILATDWGNCSVKAFDKDGKYLGDHFFPKSGDDAGRIHGITLKDANTICTTLPSYKKIATITVQYTGHKVEFSPILHATKRRYFGIAHLARTKQLVVGTTDTVDILSYNCRYIMSFSQNVFANPYNMGIETSGRVLISDTKKNCLFQISADQEVKKIEVGQDYKQLRGITVDSNGNIFFAAIKCDGIGWINSEGEMMGFITAAKVVKAVGIHVQKTRTGEWLVVAQDDGTVKLFLLTTNKH